MFVSNNLYNRPLPTRGNVQLIGGGQTRQSQIIALRLKGTSSQPSVRKQTTPKKLSIATSGGLRLLDFSLPSSTMSMSSPESTGSLHLSLNKISTCFLLTHNTMNTNLLSHLPLVSPDTISPAAVSWFLQYHQLEIDKSRSRLPSCSHRRSRRRILQA